MKPEIKFIQVNQVPTKILVYDDDDGGGNELDCHTKFNKQRLIMMITGNPGEIEYYTDFLSTLYSELKIPLIGVSHAGHSRMPGCYSRPSINSELFGLQAQISHKAQFIRNHIDSTTKIILIGHSIGCYIILELLDRYPDIARMVGLE